MVKNDLSERDLLIKAQNYCSVAEHCVAEVRDKLYQWGATAEVRDRVIDSLLDKGFIDESRYAAAFVHDKVAFQGWGREKIRMMLIMKHISAAVIDQALATIDEEEYNRQLSRLIEQKQQELFNSKLTNETATLNSKLSTLNYKAKLVRFLAQRGFTTAEIMSKINI